MKEQAIKNVIEFTGKIANDIKEEPWRIFRIMAEFVESFEEMSKQGPAVTVFGSARTKPEEQDYKDAVKMGALLAEHNYGVITGGGPGIMEASHKGAKEAGGNAIGLNIKLPMEQTTNPFQTTSLDFHYFFIRKVCFLKYCAGVVVYPGGFGTLDELFESLTLIQTEKINKIPVVLVGKEFWTPMFAWIKNTMLRDKRISPEDLELFKIVDNADESMQYLLDSHMKGIDVIKGI